MRILHLVAAFFVIALAASPGLSHEFKVGDLVLKHPWTRATAPGAPVAGGYMTIINNGSTDDRLVGGSFARSERVEIHSMSMSGDVMKMEAMPQGLPIPAGSTIALKPGSFHLMMMGLKDQLIDGEMVAGTLVFEKAGSVQVEFVVESMGAKDADHAGHGTHKTSDAVQEDDPTLIEKTLKSMFDKPENPLTVSPVVVVSDVAIAGWTQGAMGGRALLRRVHGKWSIQLCSGDALKEAAALEKAGLSAGDASALASALAQAEAGLDAARLKLFSSFEGTVLMDAHGVSHSN
jgi:copper(I)-binding protein